MQQPSEKGVVMLNRLPIPVGRLLEFVGDVGGVLADAYGPIVEPDDPARDPVGMRVSCTVTSAGTYHR